MEAARNVTAKRYSEALFSAAQGVHALKEVAADLDKLKVIFKENQQYLKFILPKVVPSKIKNIFLNTAISKLELNEITRNFLRVLVRQNKVYAIDDIQKAFFESLEVHNNELRVFVTSAVALPEAESKKLSNELGAIFNKKIILNVVVDKNVLGGLSVRVGSQLLDATLKNKLQRIRKLALQN
ncbi:ATP synthase F1 subunit delta [Holosporaceae bacterium 'Namur']|nr:ATP synthase F1 subunit delta [Holosporaceae bacterium 'Namur']